MGLFRKSGHTLQQRREAEDRARSMGSYYSQDTVIVPLPDGARVEVTCPSNSRWRDPGATECVTFDKSGKLLEKRRYPK